MTYALRTNPTRISDGVGLVCGSHRFAGFQHRRHLPGAAFDHMSDEIRPGYQAALASLQSPTYGWLWLSVTHHPGDTVSATQSEAPVQAANGWGGVGCAPDAVSHRQNSQIQRVAALRRGHRGLSLFVK